MSTATAAPAACPECGGDLWDNRADNAKKQDGRRRPDFRCKENRDHVIWPPREKKGDGRSTGSNGTAPVAAPAPVLTAEQKGEALRRMLSLHTTITRHVISQESTLMETGKVGDSPEAASTRINTLFIAAKEMGLHR
jgi:hypothetical protein